MKLPEVVVLIVKFLAVTTGGTRVKFEKVGQKDLSELGRGLKKWFPFLMQRVVRLGLEPDQTSPTVFKPFVFYSTCSSCYKKDEGVFSQYNGC
jgi:hypothetical protein